jgi:hypothetical protein
MGDQPLTLVNHYTSCTEAVLVCDSLATAHGRPAAFQPKFHLFPHAAMVLTGRGPDDVQWRMLWDLSHHCYTGGIDGAQKILPGLLQDAQAEMEERYPLALDLTSQIALVGFSPAQNRYLAVHFWSTNDFEPEPQPPGVYLSPAASACRHVGRLVPLSDAMWIAGAKEQQEVLAKEKAPEWCSVGGDLFKIELTKAGINTRKLCRLPMYDEAVAEMTRGDDLSRRPEVSRDLAPGTVCPTRPVARVEA